MSDEVIFASGVALPSQCSSCCPDLDVRGFIETPCHAHQPEVPLGIDDALVVSHGYIAGSAECGEGNKAWNDLLMRGRT